MRPDNGIMDLTANEAAAELVISATRVRWYAKNERIVGARKVGGVWLFPSPVQLLASSDSQPSRSNVAETPDPSGVVRTTPDAADSPDEPPADNPTEVNAMADCPNCAIKDHKLELATEKTETAKAQLATVNAELATAKTNGSKAAPGMPTVEAFVKHCEDGKCPEHKAAFDGVKEQIVAAAWDNIPDDKLAELAKAKGILPKRIELGGLSRSAA